MNHVQRLNKKKVLVGLSGGVDSAVAAFLLVEQGYDVAGITMAVYDGPAGAPKSGACYDCGEKDDIESASRLAGLLGIPYHVFDCKKEYEKIVLSYFRETYLSGKTPNPCVRCNHMMKFGVLPAMALKHGVESDFFATGHYVRKEFSPQYGRDVLLRGVDRRKDQSYFLYRLGAGQLQNILLPLGGMKKEEVRELARKNGFPMHDKPDSQDFYTGDYAELVSKADLPGEIVNTDGKVLGRHSGYWRFTPGQRKGLGVSSREPLYVLSVNAMHNRVVVGSAEQSLQQRCFLEKTVFNISIAEAGNFLEAQLRSTPNTAEAFVRHVEGDRVEVIFSNAQTGIAPGQSIVFYLGDMLVGGGIIC